MTKDQKNEVIEALKGKFSQYSNFYVTDTESLSVEQIGKLRRACFDKNVEMKVAKNSLIKKALEALDTEKYTGVYDALHQVTALMFSENPKEPALIISSFRKDSKAERPVLKAAYINGDVYMGDNSLVGLTKIKTKNELIGDVIGLLQSPAKRVIAALLNYHESKSSAAAEPAIAAPAAEVKAAEPEAKAKPASEQAKPETQPEVKAAAAETKAVEPEAKAAVKAAEPETKAVEPEAKAEVKAVEPETKAVEPEAKAAVKAAEPEAKAVEPEAKAEPEAQSETDASKTADNNEATSAEDNEEKPAE